MSDCDTPSQFQEDPAFVRVKRRSRWSFFYVLFVCIFLVTDLGLDPLVQPSYAAPAKNPNPVLTRPNWLQPVTAKQPPSNAIRVTGRPDTKPVPIGHGDAQRMFSAALHLTPGAQHFLSPDKQLSIDIAAGTVTAKQVQAAGGTITLQVDQMSGASGGSSGGHIILGTYQLHLRDAKGNLLTTLQLAHPLSLQYHLLTSQKGMIWDDQDVYALWDGEAGNTQSSANVATSSRPTTTSSLARLASLRSAAQSPRLVKTKKDTKNETWSVSTALTPREISLTPASLANTAQTSVMAAASTSTVTFSTAAPQASWGSASEFGVGLSSGSLDYSYPISAPVGPGGFTPPIGLSYSSSAVNETHNVQAAAPWVGEGWSLSLGSISWSQLNVTPGTTNRQENVWTINDPGGVSGQLIPPDIDASTAPLPSYKPDITNLPAQYIWHSAPESHAKIQEVNFNGQPCWHVWLANGEMQEFGCTDESRQSAVVNGASVQYRWDLDLMVDRYGNQIRVHYQRIHPTSSVVRDAVISSIEYDDPSCHQTTFNGATAACSTWNPMVKLVFDAGTKVNQLTNTSGGCATWTGTDSRCDDAVDLSGSGGLPIGSSWNAYVLNDLQVQVQGHLLQKYVFSYEQTPPQTITDPLTGKQQSAAGYLDLTKIQEFGDQGNSLNSPVINISYVSAIQHYEDLGLTATPTTNCIPSWSPKNSSGQCYLWSQSYNGRYISMFDNGRGWHENMTWKEARANTHGVDSGEVLNDPFTCDGHEQATNLCSQADDNQWSRIVIQQRQSVTNTNVTSTWQYQYSLRTGWQNGFCSNCTTGFTWGNINDADYADFYNGQFSSFASALEILPDNSSVNHFFYSSPGWGVAESGITCYRKNGMQCAVVPYWNPDVGMAGKEKTA